MTNTAEGVLVALKHIGACIPLKKCIYFKEVLMKMQITNISSKLYCKPLMNIIFCESYFFFSGGLLHLIFLGSSL